ncbi:hypothetical protein FKM82_030169 [Ascaphus truei]
MYVRKSRLMLKATPPLMGKKNVQYQREMPGECLKETLGPLTYSYFLHSNSDVSRPPTPFVKVPKNRHLFI